MIKEKNEIFVEYQNCKTTQDKIDYLKSLRDVDTNNTLGIEFMTPPALLASPFLCAGLPTILDHDFLYVVFSYFYSLVLILDCHL